MTECEGRMITPEGVYPCELTPPHEDNHRTTIGDAVWAWDGAGRKYLHSRIWRPAAAADPPSILFDVRLLGGGKARMWLLPSPPEVEP